VYRPSHLTKHQRDALYRALCDSHRFSITASMHTLDGHPYKKLQPITDGTINGDAGGRNLDCTIVDPRRRMHDVEGIQSARFIIRINYAVPVEELDEVVEFTGPLDSCTREDALVRITARGKGSLLQTPFADPFVIPKGVRKVDAIRRIAVHRGELAQHVDLPERPATLHDAFTVDVDQQPWHRMQDLAESLDLNLFYRQDGTLLGRPPQESPAFTFHTGRTGFLTSMPAVAVNDKDFHNVVELSWGKQDAQHGVYTAHAPPAHPLSPQTLSWNGVPGKRVLRHRAKEVKTRQTAIRLAHNMLDRELTHTVTVAAECFPFPFLEPGDLYRFRSTDYSDVTTVPTWTLPLTPGQAMTLGGTDVRNRG
jgi:hypothetical protein